MLVLVLVVRDFVETLKVALELDVVVLGSLEKSVVEVVEENRGGREVSTSLSIITSFPVIALRNFICSLNSTCRHQDLIQ